MILTSIIEHIGNTPLLLIPEDIHGFIGLEIYAKLEFLNPFGSIKDRTALGIMKESGNKDIIESSSGNTAKGLGILANLSNKKFLTVTNRIKQKEIESILKIIGVEIKNLPPGSECPDPHDPNSPFGVIKRIVSENPGKYYWTDQYTNEANPAIHRDTTAREIDDDIGIPDFFFSGLGTTGSSRGIIEYFDEKIGEMKSIGIITAVGSYIPGIRNSHEMSEVGLFVKKYYTDIIPVNDQDAIDSMLTLIQKCGMLVGPTTGAVYHGMISYLRSLDLESLNRKKVVFIACDRVEPYTSYIREKCPDLFEGNKKKKGIQKTILGKSQEILYQEFYDSFENFLIIDLRSCGSYDLGHIDGSICVSSPEIQNFISKGFLPFPKEKHIVFICPYGEESIIISQIANGMGYETSSLKGGYQEYIELGGVVHHNL